MRYPDVLDAIGDTPLVGLPNLSPSPDVRLWAKLEGQNPTGSVKDRIARAMIEAAEASGELTTDRTILEPTSGNTGIALAMVARRKGYALTVVIPDNASDERIRLLELFGAEIVLSPGDKGTNGSIEIARRLAADDRYFMPFQYGNPANPKAHEEGTGEEIVRDLPEITHFVAGLGTGGTLTGVGRRLKRHAEREGIFAGISSGAVLHIARRVASELDRGDVVCLLADGGWKYLSTQAWAPEIDRAEKNVSETLWW
jgi:cysteine synthase B